MKYEIPEGWTQRGAQTSSGSTNTPPPANVGQPQLCEGEMIIDDGTANGYTYYVVQCEDGKYKTIVPGLKQNKDYVSTPKRNRQDALQDVFTVLNNTLC